MADYNPQENSNIKISSLELIEQHIKGNFDILNNLERKKESQDSEFSFELNCHAHMMSALIEIEQLIVNYIWLDKKIDLDSKLNSEKEIKRAIEHLEEVKHKKYHSSQNTLYSQEKNDVISFEDKDKKIQEHIYRVTGSYVTFLELRGNAYTQLGESLTRKFESEYIGILMSNNSLNKTEAIQILKGAKINLINGRDSLRKLLNILNHYNQSNLRDRIIECNQLKKVSLLAEFNVRHTFSRILYVDEKLNSLKGCSKRKVPARSKAIRKGNRSYVVRFLEAHCNMLKVILGLLSQLAVVTIFLNKSKLREILSPRESKDKSKQE